MSDYFGSSGDMNGDSEGCGMYIAALIAVGLLIGWLLFGGGA